MNNVTDLQAWISGRLVPLDLPPKPVITCIAAPGVWNPCGPYSGEHHQTAAARGICCQQVVTQ